MKWISTAEQTPPYHERIMIDVGGSIPVRIGIFVKASDRFYSNNDRFELSEVSHWMPLPLTIRELLK